MEDFKELFEGLNVRMHRKQKRLLETMHCLKQEKWVIVVAKKIAL